MISKLKIEASAALSAIVSLLILGTFVFRYLEHWTWIQAFYFSVVTITTVGYGDLYPTTDISRLFTAFYILMGVAIALTSLGIIGKNYFENRRGNIIDNIIEKTNGRKE